MGYLYDVAQRHLDAYGVRAAALARRMGTSPQTLDSWKNRGLRQLPERRLLEALARETRTPYGEVLTAALRDIGYLPGEREGRAEQPAAIAPAASAAAQPTPTAVDELADLRAQFRSDLVAAVTASQSTADSRLVEVEQLADDYIEDADAILARRHASDRVNRSEAG